MLNNWKYYTEGLHYRRALEGDVLWLKRGYIAFSMSLHSVPNERLLRFYEDVILEYLESPNG